MKNERSLDEIINHLLAEKHEDSDGIYWLDKNLSDSLGNDIYSGSTGILYFLYSAYIQKPSAVLKDCILQGCKHTLKQLKNQPFANGYYCGTLGSLSLLLVIAKNLALDEISKYCLSVLQIHLDMHMQSTNHDVLEGNAGTLLALLHCRNEAELEKTKQLDEHIHATIIQLIKGIEFDKDGIFWNLMPFQIKGICGFAHGGSGVAFVFTELAKAYNFDFFHNIALASYTYEKNCYLDEINNWPDFRNGIFQKEQEFEYKQNFQLNNKAYFETIGDTVAWCHGGPGVAVSIINSLTYKGNIKFKQALIHIEKKIEESLENQPCEIKDLTLCHGGGGLRLILNSIRRNTLSSFSFLDGNNIINEEAGSYFQIVKNSGPGLMNGLSGIGYSLIHSQNMDKKNILSPSLKGYEHFSSKSFNLTDRREFIVHLAKKHFPRSMDLIKNHIHKIPDSELKLKNISYQVLQKMVKQLNQTLLNPFFKESFKFDQRINRLNLKRFSNCYFSTKEQVHHDYFEEMVKMDIKSIMDTAVVVTEYCDLIHTDGLENRLGFHEETASLLNVITSAGSMQLELNYLSTWIISYFKKQIKIGSFITTFHKANKQNTASFTEISKIIIDQIMIFIKMGVITPDIQIPLPSYE